MTKQELIEMIDATINENASRGITGKGLNLALNEIINAMGTGDGDGNGALTLFFAQGQETEEQKEANIAVREQCRAIAEAGGTLPVIVIDMSYMYASQLGPGVAMAYTAAGCMFDTTGALTGEPTFVLMMNQGSTTVSFVVNEDGTITMENELSAMSLK